MQLAKKAFQANGKEVVVTIVNLGDEDGMFVPDVAKLLGTTPQSIGQSIKTHGLKIESPAFDDIQKLKSLGLINKMVVRINWASKETIRQLVRIVGTPEAQAAYNHLWDISENPVVAAEHFTALGKGAELVAEVAKLKDADSQRPLTQEQKSAVSRLVEQRLRDIGINPMVQWLWTTPLGIDKERNPKKMLLWDLRCNYFTDSFAAGLFWTDIPTSNFDDVVQFIQKWEPDTKQLGTLKWKKALQLRSQDDLAVYKSERARAASAASEAFLAANKAKAAAKAAKKKEKKA